MSEKDNIQKLMTDKGVEFRDFIISKIETRKDEAGKESMIIEGVPCVFNQETILWKTQYSEMREKVERTAFDDADFSDTIFNYNHCGRVFARTRNNSLKLWCEDDGLHMKTELWDDDEGHKQLYRDIKRGNIDKMSFAFTVSEQKTECLESMDEEKTTYIRTIQKINKVYDVSAVDIPAYDATTISARRVFDAVSKEHEAVSRNRLANKIKLKIKLEGI